MAMNLSANLTPRERLMAANEAIHTGSIFGMPTRILAALASFVLPLQVRERALDMDPPDDPRPARLKSAMESHA